MQRVAGIGTFLHGQQMKMASGRKNVFIVIPGFHQQGKPGQLSSPVINVQAEQIVF
jgi:hypothetical protein